MSRGSGSASREQLSVLRMKPHDESPSGKSCGRRDKRWGLVTPQKTSRIGCVNVTTLNREEGRDILAARTLEKYDMDICGLSEVRWSGSGKERIGKYTLFYSGNSKGSEYGVGIAVRERLVGSVTAWAPVNDRIIWLRFNAKNVPTTIVQCYAPHEERPTKEKDEFYACLDDVVRRVPGRDLLIVMGDFNARVGNDCSTWSRNIGKFGAPEVVNDNGLRLLEYCAARDMVVTGTYFQHKKVHTYTWYQRGTQFRSQIDHILVRRRWFSAVNDTRAYRGAEFNNTDHRLVLSKMKIHLSLKRRPLQAIPDVARLAQTEKRLEFEVELQNRFDCLGDELPSIEDEWIRLSEMTKEVAMKVCGTRKRKRAEWVTEEVVQLADKKAELFARWQAIESGEHQAAQQAHDEYRVANKVCLKAAKEAKRSHIRRIASDLENEARRHNTRALYQKVGELKGSSRTDMGFLREKDGQLIEDGMERIRERWKEHFDQLLNAGRELTDECLQQLEVPSGSDEEPCPSLTEVEEAVSKLKNHKACGADGIYGEMLKAGGGTMVKHLHHLITRIWSCERVPEDWTKAIIVPLFKKGDPSVCDNWRGLSMLSVVGKVLAHVILARMCPVIEGRISECQAGFRKARGCADQIFTLRRVMEQARDKKMSLSLCFVDFKAAYDSLNRGGLWRILRRYGVSDKMCNIIRALYGSSKSAVRVDGELSDWFSVKTGVRQGCVLSPMLFNIYMDHVIREALEGVKHGVMVEYRMPGGRVVRGDLVAGKELVFALLYADDLVLICESEEALKETMIRLEEVTQRYGLNISVKKTKKLITGESSDSNAAELSLRQEAVEQVDEFVYLGSAMTNTGSSEKDIIRRISLGLYKFNELKAVWAHREISLKTKIQIYRAVVMSTVLYGAESWTCSDRDYARLNVFHTKRLRAIVGKRRDEISNKDLFRLTGMCELEMHVRKARLR